MMTGKKALGEELDRLTLENSILKGKNGELAKGLSDKAIKYNELLKHSEELQNRLIDTEVQVSMFREGFKKITTYASVISPQFIKIVQEIEHMLEQGGIRKNVVHSPLQNSQCNETQAVKPMIEENIVYPRVDDEEDDAIETIEDNEIQVNNGLETLQEEDKAEHTIPNGSNQSALISGIFKDVRAYIAPITSANYSPTTSNLNTTLILNAPAVNSDTEMPAVSPNTSNMENSLDNMSTIVQINESLYQEELDETKMPEVTENTTSYDPLEGPSTLSDTTKNQDLTMSMFKLLPAATGNKTSTPCRSTALYQGVDVNDMHVMTRRRNNQLTGAKRAGNLSLEPFRNCSVTLNRRSPSRLVEHQLDTPNEQTPTSTSSVVLEEGRPRRTTRCTKSLKEPSLNRKMRR